jgi:hypothetical protein
MSCCDCLNQSELSYSYQKWTRLNVCIHINTDCHLVTHFQPCPNLFDQVKAREAAHDTCIVTLSVTSGMCNHLSFANEQHTLDNMWDWSIMKEWTAMFFMTKQIMELGRKIFTLVSLWDPKFPPTSMWLTVYIEIWMAIAQKHWLVSSILIVFFIHIFFMVHSTID